MQLAFRWFGPADPIPLAWIRQVPVIRGIVSALHDVPAGDVWPMDSLDCLAQRIDDAGFTFSVIESLPVHEDIKLGHPDRDRWIDNYCATLENIAAIGVEVVCYNFMPVFDWLRTDLELRLPDGSLTLAFDDADLAGFDPARRAAVLPGWFARRSPEQLEALLAAWAAIDDEQLWDNLGHFLERVVPAARAAGIRLAVHPDDPPWPVLGLPRILTGAPALQRLIELVDDPANGVTFCTGSLGALPENDLPAMIHALRGRIHFAHCRNVRRDGLRKFRETAHPTACGDVDMRAAMRALRDTGFSGPLRPDHGRMIWGETGAPGYGLHDRALGAMYLHGLWEALTRDV